MVAVNSATPPEMLSVPAREADATVRRWAAVNSSVSPEALIALKLDADPA